MGSQEGLLVSLCSADDLGASQPCHPIILISHHIWAQPRASLSLLCLQARWNSWTTSPSPLVHEDKVHPKEAPKRHWQSVVQQEFDGVELKHFPV